MKAIGFTQSLDISDINSFFSFETDMSTPTGHDVLVKIEAISVNPVDYKIRQNSAKEAPLAQPKVIGWDAAGTVVAVGERVSLFKKGDTVYYAGDINRQGCNAEYQLVDERIVGRKPRSLSMAEAAALPLTTLTAWEMLFDRIRINQRDKGKTILIIGGAGGVGSIAIQLAKKIAGLHVIATASRPESTAWCLQQGADAVVNPHQLRDEMMRLGIDGVDFILDLVDTGVYWDAMSQLIRPQGHIASITGSGSPIPLNKLKTKSVSFSWEYMFTRSFFQTDDMIRQHEILNEAAHLFDSLILNHTLCQTLDGFNVENLKKAHQQLESGTTIGKLVIRF